MSKKIYFLLFLVLSVLMLMQGCTISEQENQDNNTAEETDVLECPKGIGNESAPGTCNLYRDENNDGYCDFQ